MVITGSMRYWITRLYGCLRLKKPELTVRRMMTKGEIKQELLRAYRKDYAPHLNHDFHIAVVLTKAENSCSSEVQILRMRDMICEAVDELAGEGLVR